MFQPLDMKALQEDLDKASQEFQKRRSLIPKILSFPSGTALEELVGVLTDRYLKLMMSTDPNNVGKIAYYQGCYSSYTAILNELHNKIEEEDDDPENR